MGIRNYPKISDMKKNPPVALLENDEVFRLLLWDIQKSSGLTITEFSETFSIPEHLWKRWLEGRNLPRLDMRKVVIARFYASSGSSAS